MGPKLCAIINCHWILQKICAEISQNSSVTTRPVEYYYHTLCEVSDISMEEAPRKTPFDSREKPHLNTVSVQKMYNGENGIHKYMCTLSTHFTEITLHTLLKYFDCNYLHRCFFPVQ